MKRSEIINVILEFGKEFELKTEDECSYLLSKLERAGMMPPDTLPNCLSLAEYASQFSSRVNNRYKWEKEGEL